MFATAGQAFVFLALVYAGLAVGVLYDVFALLRHGARAGVWRTALFDLLFWCGAAGIVAAALIAAGGEGLRAYALLGCACGWLLYWMGIHRILVWCARGIAKCASRLYARYGKKTGAEESGLAGNGGVAANNAHITDMKEGGFHAEKASPARGRRA